MTINRETRKNNDALVQWNTQQLLQRMRLTWKKAPGGTSTRASCKTSLSLKSYSKSHLIQWQDFSTPKAGGPGPNSVRELDPTCRH